MKTTSKFTFTFILAMIVLTIACGPSYVQPMAYQQPQYDYNPGYSPDNVIADAIIASAIVNGINGYYGPGHIFYPQAYYGGVPGYYVGGVFHTSTQYRTTIINNYNVGRAEFQRNPAQYAQRHPSMVTKPVYSGQSGSSTGRQSNGQVQSKPVYGGGGIMGRSSTPSQQYQQKPSYGGGGSMGRSSSPSVSSRPSYSSGGSMGRSSSSSFGGSMSRSSSSGMGRSSRR